jgi:hypothetical protein
MGWSLAPKVAHRIQLVLTVISWHRLDQDFFLGCVRGTDTFLFSLLSV